MRNEQEWAEWSKDQATDSGRNWFAKAVNEMRRQVEEMERYAKRYDEMESLKEKADVLSWAINHLQQILSPLRLDIALMAARELGEVDGIESLLKQQKKEAENS